MHNLYTVFGYEFLRTIKKKSFWISILAIPIVLVALFGISYLSSTKARGAEKEMDQNKFSLAVLDESGIVSQSVLGAAGAEREEQRASGIEKVIQGKLDAFIHYPADPSTEKVEIFAKDAGLMENGKYTSAAKNLLTSSVKSGLGPTQVAILEGGAGSQLQAFKDGHEAQGFEAAIVPGAFLVLFYFMIILLGNQMLTSVTEEKENRVIEMILTTVEARALIFGKTLSIIALGMVQIIVLLVPPAVAFIFFRERLAFLAIDLSAVGIDPWRVLIGAALFFFSFLLYAGVLIATGAAVPTAKEAGSFFGVIMLFLFAPLYAVTAIMTDPGQIIVTVFSYFPLTAPLTLMLRNAIGNLSILESAIGIGIISATGILMFLLAIRIFQRGALEYGRRLSIRELVGR